MNSTERNAIAACQWLRKYGDTPSQISIQWVKSRTWGMNPHVICRNEIVGKASGCGYDKESAALAEFLHFLPTNADDQRKVWATSGCGVSSLADALLSCGWVLTHTYSGKTEDGYTIVRKA